MKTTPQPNKSTQPTTATLQKAKLMRMRRFLHEENFAINYFELKLMKSRGSQPTKHKLICDSSVVHAVVKKDNINKVSLERECFAVGDPWKGLLPLKPVEIPWEELAPFMVDGMKINSGTKSFQ